MPDAQFEQLQQTLSHRYDLEGVVGRGGMGTVYRGRHVSLDSPVAIKVLPIPASLGADELARFRREAMVAARLSNPHIVPVFEFEIRGDIAYLVMPLVEGMSLAERLLTDGPLSLTDARALITQIGGALAFAHERGIVHRDVKPANILWEPANQRWLITDFGLARPVRPADGTITATGAVLGTPAYMPPEQAAGAEIDGRADLYSLAATLCEALTGRRLEPMAEAEQAAAVLQAARPDLPERWVRALTAPLALRQDERPASVGDWIASLDAAERHRRRRWVGAAVAGAAGVALVAGIYPLVRGPQRATPPAREVIAVLPFTDATPLLLGRGVTAAFEEELRWVPTVQVVPAAAVATVLDGATLTPAGRDSGAALVLDRFDATGVLLGSIAGGDAGITVTVQLRRADGSPTSTATRRGPPDSLASVVSGAVLDLFATSGDAAPYRPALPGGGLAAMRALRAGDSLFRAAEYAAAIGQYERVLSLDSTYALAAFKRMLAEVLRVQPTRASRAVRAALDPVRRYRDNLDPLNRALLEAYEVLVADGDVEGAHGRVRDLTDRYPLAVDAWFVRGYLEFYFGPLFGTPPTSARWALERAVALDPGFAAARGLLGWIALLDGDDDVARRELRAYLAIDSTSTWAALARLGDSLRLRGDRVAVAALRRIDDRPTATLELFALAGSSLQLRPAERLLVGDAARVLRDRATTAEERATAFRLQLGNALGSGRAATVDTLFREGLRRNVPRDELDHATVLLAVTGLGENTPPARIGEAADRLLADTGAPDAAWLAARWFRGRDATRAQRARTALRTLARRAGGEALLGRSLEADLTALDRLSAGDTLAAFREWAAATTRFQFEQVPFGLVASLWPLRLDWARTAAARGDHAEVLLATSTFEYSAGFMDQAARPIALPLRAAALDATGDRLGARDLRRRYADVLRDASGAWVTLRDSLRTLSGTP